LLPFGRDWSFRYAISGAEGQTAGGEVYDRVDRFLSCEAACQAAPHGGKPQTEHRAEFYDT